MRLMLDLIVRLSHEFWALGSDNTCGGIPSEHMYVQVCIVSAVYQYMSVS